MHFTSCSTSSSSPTLVCQLGTRLVESIGRDSASFPLSRVRNSQTFVLELESCVFLLRQHGPLICPPSVSWEIGRRKRLGQASASVVVPHEAADDLELSDESPSTSNPSSKILDDGIPVSEHSTLGPIAESTHWSWVKEEARSIVVDFLKTRGLNATLSANAVKEAPTFITHVVSLLESCYPARYLSGKELTGNEIRSVLLPYLDRLGKTDLTDADDVLSNLPTVSTLPDLASFVPQPGITSKLLSGYPLLLEHLVDGKLPPSLSYCFSIGLNAAQIEGLVKKFPPIVGYSFEGKIQKVVNFILALDVSSSLIPKIVLKRPQLFGCNVEQNLKPSASFLEKLGVDRRRWGRILVTFPHMLTYSSSKSALVFNFLIEVGVSPDGAGKILSRFPHAVGYSVEFKMKPLVAYFHSIGIEDFSRIVTRSPQTLGLSLEGNIKPTVEFLLDLGFSKEEVALVLIRFPQILGLNAEHNLQPKWQFFLKMDRSKSELVDFPQYFGYSLENRIQPRYRVIVQKQLPWTLNRMLTTSDEIFHRLTNS